MKLNFNKQAKRMRESIREEMQTWTHAIIKKYKLVKKKK